MKTDKHETDLYILPESQAERDIIEQYLKSRDIGYQWSYSDVDGQAWHGNRFIEIPFGVHRMVDIQRAAEDCRE